jgi:hypothetical protein
VNHGIDLLLIVIGKADNTNLVDSFSVRWLSVSWLVWDLVESRLTDGAAQHDRICAAVVPECEH